MFKCSTVQDIVLTRLCAHFKLNTCKNPYQNSVSFEIWFILLMHCYILREHLVSSSVRKYLYHSSKRKTPHNELPVFITWSSHPILFTSISNANLSEVSSRTFCSSSATWNQAESRSFEHNNTEIQKTHTLTKTKVYTVYINYPIVSHTIKPTTVSIKHNFWFKIRLRVRVMALKKPSSGCV